MSGTRGVVSKLGQFLATTAEVQRYSPHVLDVKGDDSTPSALLASEPLKGTCIKIAQVAPLYESVPPQGYGGTERIVSYLTEELVRLGHDVTLFASGDSVTAAKLEAIYPQALRLATGLCCREAPLTLQLERAFGAKSD